MNTYNTITHYCTSSFLKIYTQSFTRLPRHIPSQHWELTYDPWLHQSSQDISMNRAEDGTIWIYHLGSMHFITK